MNFEESVKYLYDLGNEVLAMKLGLENITKLLDALGSPQKNYLKVQIAGTNGKGSTVAFLESICRQAGIEVGATVSPHLISVTERVRINGAEISETDFARLATMIRETSEKLVETGEIETVPTYFEQVTAIALRAFAEAQVELAILETGLGGRFDAITAARAEIVAITLIDYDHQRILGDTLAEIAAEKAAIIRADTKVVVADQPPEAMKIIVEKCVDFGITPNSAAKVRTVCGDGRFNPLEDSISNFKFQTLNFETPKSEYRDVKLNLLGKHQIENAKIAVLLAEILQDYFRISSEHIIEGLQTAKHRGRLEFYKNYLFDGAHNIAGAKALREFLDEFVNQPITMIFGAMRDKDLSEIAEIIFPKAATLILTKPDNLRSMEVEELLKFVPKDFAQENVVVAQTVDEALRIAPFHATNRIICVTGSLYLVGEAQKILRENQSQFLTD